MQARGLVGEGEEAPGTIDVQPSQLMPTGRKVDEELGCRVIDAVDQCLGLVDELTALVGPRRGPRKLGQDCGRLGPPVTVDRLVGDQADDELVELRVPARATAGEVRSQRQQQAFRSAVEIRRGGRRRRSLLGTLGVEICGLDQPFRRLVAIELVEPGSSDPFQPVGTFFLARGCLQQALREVAGCRPRAVRDRLLIRGAQQVGVVIIARSFGRIGQTNECACCHASTVSAVEQIEQLAGNLDDELWRGEIECRGSQQRMREHSPTPAAPHCTDRLQFVDRGIGIGKQVEACPAAVCALLGERDQDRNPQGLRRQGRQARPPCHLDGNRPGRRCRWRQHLADGDRIDERIERQGIAATELDQAGESCVDR